MDLDQSPDPKKTSRPFKTVSDIGGCHHSIWFNTWWAKGSYNNKFLIWEATLIRNLLLQEPYGGKLRNIFSVACVILFSEIDGPERGSDFHPRQINSFRLASRISMIIVASS